MHDHPTGRTKPTAPSLQHLPTTSLRRKSLSAAPDCDCDYRAIEEHVLGTLLGGFQRATFYMPDGTHPACEVFQVHGRWHARGSDEPLRNADRVVLSDGTVIKERI